MRQKTLAIEYRVREIVSECDSTRTFILEGADEGPEIAYEAGQFLTLHLPVEGERVISRSYSFSSSPASDLYPSITVKGEPGGEGSNWLLAHVTEGTVLAGSPASGTFRLDGTATPLRFLAAGVGVTPVFSLCQQALHATDRLVHFHYSATSPREAIFTEKFAELEHTFGDRFRMVRHYTATSGRLELDDMRQILREDREAVNYVCGPHAYIQLVRDAAEAEGLPAEKVRSEAFTPATTGTPEAKAADMPESEGVITIAGQVHTVQWPSHRTLVEVLASNGVEAPSSCRQGECLTCECRIMQGAAEMKSNGVLDEDDVADGYALACQLVPTSSKVHVNFE